MIFVQGQLNDILIMVIGNSVSSKRMRPSKSQVFHSIILARTAPWGKVRNMGVKPFRKKDYCHFQINEFTTMYPNPQPLTWHKKVATEQLSCCPGKTNGGLWMWGLHCLSLPQVRWLSGFRPTLCDWSSESHNARITKNTKNKKLKTSHGI